MQHLSVFIEWAQRGTCQIKSTQQLRFFKAQLKAAIKAHQLPVERHSDGAATFYLDNSDTHTSENFVAVSIGGIGLGACRVTLGDVVGKWDNGRYVVAR